ncbi:MAG: ABC transporter permease [Planctomycetaceae bacterium]|nr:ABC transporter permease [Planctomycetaceae bacterium]
MGKLWAICKNTFVETIRQPIYGVLILATIAALLAPMGMGAYTLETNYDETDQKMVEQWGLSTLLAAGLFIAAFSASGAVAREIDDGTALTVLTKPLSRTMFVLGKFGGLAAALTIAFYIAAIVMLMLVRHKVVASASTPFDWPVIVLGLTALACAFIIAAVGNFMFAAPFISTLVWSLAATLTVAMGLIAFIGKGWVLVPFGQGVDPQILLSLALILMAILLLTAVAVAAGTRLGSVMTLAVMLLIAAAGTAHQYLFVNLAGDYPILGWTGPLLPNLTYYLQLDALFENQPLPKYDIWRMAGYTLLYITAALAVGSALFQTRTLESLSSSRALPPLAGILAWLGRLVSVVLAGAALVLLTTPRLYSAATFIAAGACVLAAVGGWVFWGRFGHGHKWTYWCALALSGAGLLGAAAWVVWPDAIKGLADDRLIPVMTACIVAALLTALIVPSTRRHFSS